MQEKTSLEQLGFTKLIQAVTLAVADHSSFLRLAMNPFVRSLVPSGRLRLREARGQIPTVVMFPSWVYPVPL